ncbi:protein RodZ, contains Xre-like HTH and DUF4115 domains [Nocardioides scoriae]|uniref:Protein RodZ, contains Xre-like HTH and DUF4115 domains n=1 Tax=Nocardioides scoriae TaxID=642780 RepID=A0A1H1L597_9ACTN|nr:helix-turn-helix domain-containing protein [Nocardioides scoriae]SDR69567.1 protein RodZ, contains Xre-like HTH and DUF4115 domains [Nocardioides scoriae]
MNAPITAEQTGVSVRHDARIAAVVALLSAVLTVAWFARALRTGEPTDWIWCLVPAVVGVVQLMVVRDARTPLMVADELGVRVRRGDTWHGVRWQDVERVEVRSSGRFLRDGQLVVHPVGADVDPRGAEAPLDGAADGEAVAATPPLPELAVPLGLATRLEFDGLTGDLVADLDALGQGQVPVLVLTRPVPARAPRSVAVEEQPQEPVEEPVEEAAAELPVELPVDQPADQPVEEPVAAVLVEPAAAAEPERTDEVAAYAPVEPTRSSRPAARAEVHRESVRRLPDPPAIPAQRAGAPVLVARVDDLPPAPALVAPEDAVIGPMIAAARHRARLSIDTLSERTRIRPHVLECIEVDDFAACGGDFYARGHIRTLARVFGLDAEQLVEVYDLRYAQAEIEARQVFEAELATGIGGGVRTSTSGPRWSLLAACVLALVAIWGVARIFNDTPQELVSPAPGVVDSAGLAGTEPSKAPASTLAALQVSAAGASPQVVVRDKAGRILWAGELADGQSQQVIGTAPFDVTASNGQAVKVSYLGKARGTVGASAAADNRQFG